MKGNELCPQYYQPKRMDGGAVMAVMVCVSGCGRCCVRGGWRPAATELHNQSQQAADNAMQQCKAERNWLAKQIQHAAANDTQNSAEVRAVRVRHKQSVQMDQATESAEAAARAGRAATPAKRGAAHGASGVLEQAA